MTAFEMQLCSCPCTSCSRIRICVDCSSSPRAASQRHTNFPRDDQRPNRQGGDDGFFGCVLYSMFNLGQVSEDDSVVQLMMSSLSAAVAPCLGKSFQCCSRPG